MSDSNTVHIHYFLNLSINQNLDITKVSKPLPPSFSDYHDYKGYLSEVLKSLAQNAASSERNVRYSPIVFSSNGYDSVACAALGREIGCTEAVVFESKRKNRSDSGKEAVLALGYETIHEKHELDYLKTNCSEEFVAGGELGTSIFFAAAEKELEGKLLLSGVHGDKIWDRNCQTAGEDIIRSFFPDTAKTEFRLRVGYQQIPIPFIGVLNHRDVHQISNSDQMAPWSIREEYDRPIPRRIAEEKGVPREAFGIEKVGGAASSLRFLSLGYLKKVMPPKSFEDFKQYYETNKSQRKKSIHYFIRFKLYSIYCLTVFLNKLHLTVFERIMRVNKWNRKYTCSPWAPSFLLHWGVEKLGRKYSEGLMNFKK
ncbi:hypothetical protein E2R51_09505 [Jeotgalibacillus sp. S-D1]|uniref:hypothetical protein n=1 Tax=Jeotgalibacillus sp. S-D1 TaxID=2552189 RepID=UPI00105A4B83|nr:hypothetical protein [Jeotgalibacillus sp. S-D1]TDL32889.1 hypothetical protein E2R51_09505 [Jeotgalibacillus sp. S-D1]